MTFQPVIPLSGFAGWRFLERTMEAQKTSFVESIVIKRATEYFAEEISTIRTAEDLVGNRRLLEVALGAFGLDEDINSKAFIQKILEDGTISDDALANRLTDKRYRQFAEAFGFGNLGPRTSLSSFAGEIIDRYETRQFELAVGEQDGDMRLALSLANGLSDIFDQNLSDDGQWFSMMGNPPLRRTFETALGLPSSFGQIDIDLQLETFRDRSRATFGIESFSDFNAPETQETLTRLFLVRSQADGISSLSNGSVALSLLQSSRISFG
ncbi:DUF1217 domain-containing protein [Ponticoccus sp. SC2-23]|uniref:DUF1217 domain-containing protein n=1 Tax=Alexandriicola marinus TaxID=2081710 RepID=UPI000FD6D23A|nr:DUF1217 domain-containing protein [Alexandriicola marinus]MBM1220505.1 DUF1217 domain-containing protein [Ponticoccus sp. SC6-9]MBM1225191.1 DUF1217 domain-containing protein [Ponticoccus sp. SC6-15]MBM1228705.1 DUF1217 domain-containing protein [Ponticoccus sp. SC6-38]MBM1233658.1 DUF1217 domain-containing protein [Ponticoccus sp. SC6-45]MBM1239206.1 DUF1217 domain-containing protein [Ponticoccus sp. SC6-49]MBM1242988.1 DUF1217 domain-containing protein [Ponticoccus sp. SC2-64]MBM1247182